MDGPGQDREWTVIWGVQRGTLGETFPLLNVMFPEGMWKIIKKAKKKDPNFCSLNVLCSGPTLEMCGNILATRPAGQLPTETGEGLVNEMARTRTELMAKLSFNSKLQIFTSSSLVLNWGPRQGFWGSGYELTNGRREFQSPYEVCCGKRRRGA